MAAAHTCHLASRTCGDKRCSGQNFGMEVLAYQLSAISASSSFMLQHGAKRCGLQPIRPALALLAGGARSGVTAVLRGAHTV
nr:hypothetical protein CFP56_33415 [Quercus suber]